MLNCEKKMDHEKWYYYVIIIKLLYALILYCVI